MNGRTMKPMFSKWETLEKQDKPAINELNKSLDSPERDRPSKVMQGKNKEKDRSLPLIKSLKFPAGIAIPSAMQSARKEGTKATIQTPRRDSKSSKKLPALYKQHTIDQISLEMEDSQGHKSSTSVEHSNHKMVFKLKDYKGLNEPLHLDFLSRQGTGASRSQLLHKVKEDTKIQKRRNNYYIEGLQPNHPEYFKYRSHLEKAHGELVKLQKDVISRERRKCEFPAKLRRKEHILMLDLDETLLHCCNFDPKEAREAQFSVTYLEDNGKETLARINLRPHLREFLQSMNEHYDIGVYTAGGKNYAQAMVNFIDPKRVFIKHLLHREHCIPTLRGFTLKDLKLLEADASKVILVDNSVYSFYLQLENGVPILNFIDDHNDSELVKLEQFLIELKAQSNIPSFLQNYFMFGLYSVFSKVNSLEYRLRSQLLPSNF